MSSSDLNLYLEKAEKKPPLINRRAHTFDLVRESVVQCVKTMTTSIILSSLSDEINICLVTRYDNMEVIKVSAY